MDGSPSADSCRNWRIFDLVDENWRHPPVVEAGRIPRTYSPECGVGAPGPSPARRISATGAADPGPVLERHGGLVDEHPEAVQGAQAPGPGGREQRGDGRQVDEVGHQRRLGQGRQRGVVDRGGCRVHPQRGGVDEQIGRRQMGGQLARRGRRRPTRSGEQRRRLRLVERTVHHGHLGRPGLGQRQHDGPRRAPGAQRRRTAGRPGSKPAVGPERRHEAGAVGVVADESVAVAGPRS